MVFNNVYYFVDFPVIKNTEMEKKIECRFLHATEEQKWISITN